MPFHFIIKAWQKVSFETFQAIQRVEIHEPFGLTDEEGTALWNSALEEIYFTDCPSLMVL